MQANLAMRAVAREDEDTGRGIVSKMGYDGGRRGTGCLVWPEKQQASSGAPGDIAGPFVHCFITIIPSAYTPGNPTSRKPRAAVEYVVR